MAAFRYKRTSQPQTQVGIDWGNPITRGLEFAGADSATGRIEFKTGALSGTVLGTVSYGSSVSAAGVKYSSSGSMLFPEVLTTSANITFATLFIKTGTVGDYSRPFGRTANNGLTPPYANWDFEINPAGNGQNVIIANVHSSGSIYSTPNTGNVFPDDGLPHFALAVNSTGYLRLFIDGVLLPGQSGAGAGNATNSNTNSKIIFGGSSSASVANTFNGFVPLGLFWNRALSDAEIRSLSDNPWQIFQPVQRAIYVGEAAAGGDTYTLTAEAGSYTETGNAATLAYNRLFTADAGSYALTGNAATLAFNRTLAAAQASYSETGNAATLAFNRTLIADAAAYALTGNAATLTYTPISGATYTLAAAAGDYTLTGSDATLAYNRALIADQGAYTLTGDAANLAVNRTLAANTGAYSLTGSDAALVAVRKLVADATAYALSAADATLTYTPISYPVIGRPASDTSNSGWTPSTGSDLYAMVDEVTPSDADYISASSVGAVCQMALNTTAYPGSASQVLKFRASSSTGNSVIVRLKEGATVIRSATQALTATDTEYSITLTSGEIAAITSGNLSVELESA